LVAVHAAGVVHRDLKPGNVMMVGGQPVVIDFGIAQAPDSTRLTMTGMFMGTPGYLAPEVIEGNTSGPGADVHSWAATLAYAATGRPPFGTGQYETIFYRIVHGQPDLDRMPAPLLPIVLAALARDPSRRPSAAELAEFTARLDAESLVPAPAGAALAGHSDPAQAILSGQATRTALDGQAQLPAARLAAAGLAGAVAPAWPVSRPTGAGPQDDFADLLRPVRYSPPAAGPGQLTAGGRGQLPGGQAPAAGPQPGARSASQAGRLPLVLATLAALVAISVLLPIAGAVAALAVLVLLRATDVTSGWLARRRSRQGSRSSDPVSATAFYPWAVCRSVLSFLLRAPLALLCAAVVAVLAVLAGGPAELPKAGGYAAGAIVACYCIGPGSRACRRPLSNFYGRIARSVPAALIGSFGLAAMVAAVVVAAATMTPGYWPDWHLGNQLQAATSTLSHPALNHLSGNLPGHVTDLGKRLVNLLGRL
jgi:hypothetical protein